MTEPTFGGWQYCPVCREEYGAGWPWITVKRPASGLSREWDERICSVRCTKIFFDLEYGRYPDLPVPTLKEDSK